VNATRQCTQRPDPNARLRPGGVARHAPRW
jgi:hypothetical protein